MKKIIVPLLCLLTISTNSQNLVPNGSFETFSSCPPTSVACVGRIDLLNSWFIPADGNSPDLYSACHVPPFPGLDVGVPSNMYGIQSARTGNSYAGFYPLTEYIEVQLSTALTAGENYDFKMYVNQTDFAQQCTDGLGVYFSNGITTAAAGWGNSQINNATFNFITNTVGWTLISGTYTAVGGENYITIGNFFSSFYPVSNAGGSLSNSYYYIDDVSLTHVTPLPIELISFEAKEINEAVELSWITATEINNDFFTIEKSTNGIDFEAISLVQGAGNSSAKINYATVDYNLSNDVLYYRLKQTDFDGKTSTSDIRSVRINNNSQLIHAIYPNPSSGVYHISLTKSATITVLDITGKVLINNRTINADFQEILDLSLLNNGVYTLIISDNYQIETKKLMKY